jgi:uncharacterized protein YktA (UPF0223 family)
LETEFQFPFDYALYTPDEIATLIQAVEYFEKVAHGQSDGSNLAHWIKTYQSIIQNKAEEKRLDAIFKEELGFTVYDLQKKSA